jgi:hypothetical protein
MKNRFNKSSLNHMHNHLDNMKTPDGLIKTSKAENKKHKY